MIDLWQEIYGTIKRNKLRTFLTGFAVAWGIFMLIVLLGAGNGIIHAFEQNASERALNSIRIFPGWTTKSYDGLKEGRRVQLDNRDMDDTEKQFTENVISAGATVRQSNVNVSFGQEYINISLLGVYPNYTEVETVKTADGRFINYNDLKDRRKVIILHKKSADILFGKTHTEPIGQFVNASGVAYQVVGLYNDQGDREANEAYIPFSTLQTIYNKGDKLNNIIFTTKNLHSIESNEAFEKEYRKAIATNHRFDPTDESAIWIWNRFTNYLQTQEGRNLPVEHCLKNSWGWEILSEVYKAGAPVVEKKGFGSVELSDMIAGIGEVESIELVGLCTDICVISNAMILKSRFPEIPISVDASCCAGVTPESHANALRAMQMCQIQVMS